MEAKDTVMSTEELYKYFHAECFEDAHDLDNALAGQAEISFKAGLEEGKKLIEPPTDKVEAVKTQLKLSILPYLQKNQNDAWFDKVVKEICALFPQPVVKLPVKILYFGGQGIDYVEVEAIRQANPGVKFEEE